MYAQIASNKRKTWVLVTLFSAIIIAIITIFGINSGLTLEGSLILGAIISIIYCTISYFVADKVVLASTGAVELSKDQAYDVWNIVENLSIASGIPMPKIYLIDDPAPNAYATGRDPKHASITFTTGLLSSLNKLELEAVAAHEMSHIKNYDIRLMTIVVVLVGLIVLMSDVMIRLTFHGKIRGGKNDKNGNLGLIIIVVAIVLAILSPIIAQVIKLAISRTREYLADSSAALLTRHPDALANALEKIRDNGAVMKSANHATAHLFISSRFGAITEKSKGWYQKLFSTHPPINDRIEKLHTMGR